MKSLLLICMYPLSETYCVRIRAEWKQESAIPIRTSSGLHGNLLFYRRVKPILKEPKLVLDLRRMLGRKIQNQSGY